MSSAEDARRQQLIVRAVTDIAEGRVTPAGGGSMPPQAAAALRRAQELRPELSRQPLRPGVLSQAQLTAEEYLRSVGRLRHEESLTAGLAVPVRLADGRQIHVTVDKMDRVRQLRERAGLGTSAGLIVSGRPLQDEALVYDLWIRDGLGSISVANPPVAQATVRNTGG